MEPSDEDFIRRMVVQGYAVDADTTTHNGVLVWKQGQAIRPRTAPMTGTEGRRVLFQLVPEPKSVKNRLHFDIRVGPENIEAEMERLTAAGATFLHRGPAGPAGLGDDGRHRG